MTARMNETKVRVETNTINPTTTETATMKAEAYWNTLTEAQKDGFITLAETNGVGEAKTLELAIGEAYRRSPEMKAKREADKDAYENEMLTCSRSGEEVARKDAIVAGETIVAKKALTDMEKEFFGIEDEAEVVEPSNKAKASLNFIHTGRRTVPANWEAFKARHNVA